MRRSAENKTVAVVDYGMGNLRSVSQAVRACRRQGTGVDVVVTRAPRRGDGRAERVVLPGQGAMRRLHARTAGLGMQDAVLHARSSKPLMGVCVGHADAAGPQRRRQDTPGLGLIPGEVVQV